MDLQTVIKTLQIVAEETPVVIEFISKLLQEIKDLRSAHANVAQATGPASPLAGEQLDSLAHASACACVQQHGA